MAGESLEFSAVRGQLRRALFDGAFEVLVPLGQMLLAHADFACHSLESASQFAQLVAAWQEVGEQFVAEPALFESGCGAGQAQQRVGDAPRQRGDQEDHEQQTKPADEGRADCELVDGRENCGFGDVEDHFPAGQRQVGPEDAAAFVRDGDRRGSLGFGGDERPTRLTGQLGPGEPLTQHQRVVRVHHDPPGAADEKGELVGCGARRSAIGSPEADAPDDFANSIQRQVGTCDTDEVGRGHRGPGRSH